MAAMRIDLTLMWLLHVSICSDGIIFCPSDNDSEQPQNLTSDSLVFKSTPLSYESFRWTGPSQCEPSSRLLLRSFRMRLRAPCIFACGIYISEMMLYACYSKTIGFKSTSDSVAFPGVGEVEIAVRESDALEEMPHWTVS